MRLKSLDIKGFKSFADRTQVLLDNAVTGIVGPNGCGKSNIVDAIRWVIGEHKIKSLRSDSLEDLVFNGSKSRAAAGMAEVSLTFENTRNLLPTEFSTVTITRKFYKSGDSEYRLNDVACRLKDIHNLFLNTGVSNDSYAIIELGMVDDIIKDKDGSRRRMLEQAAGISIYKTRKKEAKQKLASIEQDIDRIEDILFEIGNNLRTLESQAKKAEKYLQLKSDYKEISLELARVSLTEFNEKYQHVQTQLSQEEDRKLKVETEIAGDEAQIESQKVQIVAQEQELARMQKQFNELLNRIRQLENEKQLSTQHLKHLESRETDLRNYLKHAGQQLTQLKELLSLSGEQIAEEEKNYHALQGHLETYREKVAVEKEHYDSRRKTLEQDRAELQHLQNELFDVEKKSVITDTTLNNLKQSQNRLKQEQEKRKTVLQQLTEEQKAVAKALAIKEQNWQKIQSERRLTEQQLQQYQEQLEKFREEQSVQSRKLDARRNEHDLLKSMIESLEGYPESIKFLKKNKDWQNEAPLLSDVLSVGTAYRVALESVLDQYLNYYVVADIQEALKAVALLSKHKRGKASFFLLDRFKKTSGYSEAVPEGFIPALTVVEQEPDFEPLVRHLLSQVLIAENEAALTKKDLPEGYIYVAKDGHIRRSRHAVMGGSVGAFAGNKIGRAKQLSLLAAEIKNLSEKNAAIELQKTNLQHDIQATKAKLKATDLEKERGALNRLQNQLTAIDNRIGHLEQMDKEDAARLEQLAEQRANGENDFSGTQDSIKAVREKMTAYQKSMREASDAFAAVEQSYNQANSLFNEQHLALTRQQSKLEKLKQEQGFRQGQLADLEEQVQKNKAQLSKMGEEVSATSGKLNFGNDELAELYEQKEKDSAKLNDKDRLYHLARNAVQEHEQQISRQRREKSQAEILVNSLKEKLNEMKVQVAGLKERLEVEFKVGLEVVLEQKRTTDLSLEDLNLESDRLKKRLENMGEVNPTAIDAYQETRIRHDFIREQKADLEAARATLLATIEEVEQTANSRFKETFEAVRENFIRVFKALFTEEDKADLRLTNPDDIAETGIEIYAQPKGKRPSTLTQLSGGEKTLTSTAFLFAIYLIKPAPFCILDEVDAPLDDANVDKFTGMIRKFSDKSQFIVITHNKQTMASVDVIYGVTMQEVGVSKLVPVDFRSLKN